MVFHSLFSKKHLASDTLIAFGSDSKDNSLSGQYSTAEHEWSALPQFTSKDETKTARHNASYVYVGGNRIFISGGVDSLTLKRVSSCFFLLFL